MPRLLQFDYFVFSSPAGDLLILLSFPIGFSKKRNDPISISPLLLPMYNNNINLYTHLALLDFTFGCWLRTKLLLSYYRLSVVNGFFSLFSLACPRVAAVHIDASIFDCRLTIIGFLEKFESS